MPKSKTNRLWITWEYQIRNRSMAKKLNATLFEVIEDDRPALSRYIVSAFKTVSIVHRYRPDIVFHQNPSIFLGLTLLVLRPFFRFKMVTDTHNAGIYPAEGRFLLLNFLGRLVSKKTDVLIVHNEMIAGDARAFGCEPFVLADPLPEIDMVSDIVEAPSRIVFVCRWSADEPYELVMRSFGLLVHDMPDSELFITGSPPKDLDKRLLSKNIRLTGFLSNSDYSELLKSSGLMIVLTNRTNSLNCGAYEALALGKPCVLYDTKMLRSFFGEAFIYSSLDEVSLSKAMRKGLIESRSLHLGMEALKKSYSDAYDLNVAKLENLIES